MNILHVSENSNGYEEAILIANRISKTNHLSLIEINGVRKERTNNSENLSNGYTFTATDDECTIA